MPSRDFLQRTERYTRGLALTNRVYELQDIHHWSQQETSIAINSLDESLPIGLHNVGMNISFEVIDQRSTNVFQSKHSNPS